LACGPGREEITGDLGTKWSSGKKKGRRRERGADEWGQGTREKGEEG
jgi:hypothetical protein